MSSLSADAETTISSEGTGLRRGTIVYTKTTLAVLFVWLLWGDFCFTLMEQVIPTIMPLKLKALDTPNWMLSAIMSSIPTAMSTIASPIIGFKSDLVRTRWGRRIPFLFIATPFVAFFLCLLALSPEIGKLLHQCLLNVAWLSQTTVTISCIAVFIVGYKFFDLIVGLLFGYLLNDVVPQTHLTRFYAAFRMVGVAASSLYNYYIFQFGETHMREILMCAAFLYLSGFMLMCWNVKEGEYHPPPKNHYGGLIASVKIYFSECFSHKLYIYYFLHTACWSMGGASSMFVLFLNLSLGLSLGQHGKILAIAQVVTVVLLYPAGMLADRLHPLRVMVWVKIGILFSMLLNMIWLVKTFSPQTNFYIIIGITAFTLPLNIIYLAALNPMIMRLLPASRFGQFHSAGAMTISLFSIFSSLAVGFFFDLIRTLFPAAEWGKDYCYRFCPVWTFFFFSIGLIFLLLLFREWKQCGGDYSYKPPGFDE